mgnify:CR=1 FL=1
MRQSSTINLKTIVTAGFFAAVTFLGIRCFGFRFRQQLGHHLYILDIFLLCWVCCCKAGRNGAVSGTIGLVLFDLLNGYVQAIPQVFIETIVKCLILGAILKHFVKGKDDKKTEYRAVTIGVFVYAVMNIVIEFVMGTITLLIAGSGVNAALLGALTSIPATVINASVYGRRGASYLQTDRKDI